MKFLADLGISPATVTFLRTLGHEEVRLSDVGMARATDVEIIARAAREAEVVLTFDLDYPALLALRQAERASAVVFRTMSADSAWIKPRILQFLPLIQEALEEGAIVVVEDDRVRIRRFADL